MQQHPDAESQEGFGDEAAAARPYQCGKLLAFQERQIPEHGVVHQLTVVLDESHKNADNTITNYYRLLHDKGTALDYYTNRYYVSMALPADQRPDSVRLSIKTYDGVYVKTVKI